MGKEKIVIFIFLLVIIVVIGMIVLYLRMGQNTVYVELDNGEKIVVDLAVSASEKEKGLAGRANLEMGEGMYFVFDDRGKRVFWMKGMVIPIDIVWIQDGVVVGVEERVPVEEGPGYVSYSSPERVNAVLEVGAGHAHVLGIEKGTKLKLVQ